MLPRLTRIPSVGRLTGLPWLDRLTVLNGSISMARLTGKAKPEGLCRLTVIARNTRLTRIVRLNRRRTPIRC